MKFGFQLYCPDFPIEMLNFTFREEFKNYISFPSHVKLHSLFFPYTEKALLFYNNFMFIYRKIRIL